MKYGTPSLSLVVFTAVVSMAELIGGVVLALQSAAFFNLPGAAINAVIAIGAGLLTKYFGDPGGVGSTILVTQAGLLAASFFISLVVLCVFFALVFTSPRGTFTAKDYAVAILVFVIESIPVVGGFTFWGLFVVYLKTKNMGRLAGGEGTEKQ